MVMRIDETRRDELPGAVHDRGIRRLNAGRNSSYAVVLDQKICRRGMHDIVLVVEEQDAVLQQAGHSSGSRSGVCGRRFPSRNGLSVL